MGYRGAEAIGVKLKRLLLEIAGDDCFDSGSKSRAEREQGVKSQVVHVDWLSHADNLATFHCLV